MEFYTKKVLVDYVTREGAHAHYNCHEEWLDWWTDECMDDQTEPWRVFMPYQIKSATTVTTLAKDQAQAERFCANHQMIADKISYPVQCTILDFDPVTDNFSETDPFSQLPPDL